MQQTDKYKLNKPGVDDPIAIAPLNENMDKLEAALAAETAVRQGETAGLNQRVTVLEAHKVRMAVGTYVGNGKALGDAQIVQVGFTPKLVFVRKSTVSTFCSFTSFAPHISYEVEVLKTVDGGFQTVWENHGIMNANNTTYIYAAFA